MGTVWNPTWSPVPTASGLAGLLGLTVTHAPSALERGPGGWATVEPHRGSGKRDSCRQLFPPGRPAPHVTNRQRFSSAATLLLAARRIQPCERRRLANQVVLRAGSETLSRGHVLFVREPLGGHQVRSRGEHHPHVAGISCLGSCTGARVRCPSPASSTTSEVEVGLAWRNPAPGCPQALCPLWACLLLERGHTSW